MKIVVQGIFTPWNLSIAHHSAARLARYVRLMRIDRPDLIGVTRAIKNGGYTFTGKCYHTGAIAVFCAERKGTNYILEVLV